MGDTRNYAALDWVLGEISDTLKDARQSLEAYVEDPKDDTKIRFCLTHIHQVYGSLQMVQFDGASLLAQEMEQLAQAIMGDSVVNAAEAQEVLMRSLLQLPIFLEYVKSQKQDNPSHIVPLLNDLRAARKQSYLSETDLFTPDLSSLKKVQGVKHPVTSDPQKLSQVLKKLREMYQFAAASVLRGIKVDENLVYLEKVFNRLEALTRGSLTHPTWLICAALVEGLREDKIELSVAVRGLLRHIARQLRLLADKAPNSFDELPKESLIKNLLYYVAKAESNKEKINVIQQRFSLASALLGKPASEVTEEELTQKEFTHDPSAVRSVVIALQDEMTNIKSVLDFSLNGQGVPRDIQEILPTVKRVADTLAVLGIGTLRKQMLDQVEALEKISEGEEIIEAELMQAASQIIEVEQKLEAVSKAANRSPDLASIDEREVEIDEAKLAVINECRVGLEQSKESIVEYISSQWDRSHLESVGDMLTNIRGGLEMIPLMRPASIIKSCSKFIEEQLVGGAEHPSWETLDTLADAIASIEYYLEHIAGDLKGDSESLLEVAEKSVASLGYQIGQAQKLEESSDQEQEAHTSVVADEAESPVESIKDISGTLDYVEPIEAANEVVADEPEMEVAPVAEEVDSVEASDTVIPESEPEFVPAPLETASSPEVEEVEEDEDDEVDDEIKEIFIEEAGEVYETLEEYFPRWKLNTDSEDDRTTVRRSFHTLKGSGRMVGASVIGELAWSVENMLNRVIDRTVDLMPEHVFVVETVISVVPSLVKDFEASKQKRQVETVDQLASWAHGLSNGEVSQELAAAFANGGLVLPSSDEISLDFSSEETTQDSDDQEDQALKEIFSSEAQTHLETISEFIREMEEAAPIYSPPTDDLQRALHTLKGSAKMAQIVPIGAMAEPLEAFAKELISYQVSINEDILQLVRDIVNYTSEGLEQINSGNPVDIPKTGQFVARTEELRELAVGHLVRLREQNVDGSHPVDPELLSIFMAEEMDQLLDADVVIQQWRDGIVGAEKINELTKELSTLETGARHANLPDLMSLSGLLKSVEEKGLSGEINRDDFFYDTLIDGHNALLDMVDSVAAGQHVSAPESSIIESIESLFSLAPAQPDEDVQDKETQVPEEQSAGEVSDFTADMHVEQTASEETQDSDIVSLENSESVIDAHSDDHSEPQQIQDEDADISEFGEAVDLSPDSEAGEIVSLEPYLDSGFTEQDQVSEQVEPIESGFDTSSSELNVSNFDSIETEPQDESAYEFSEEGEIHINLSPENEIGLEAPELSDLPESIELGESGDIENVEFIVEESRGFDEPEYDGEIELVEEPDGSGDSEVIADMVEVDIGDTQEDVTPVVSFDSTDSEPELELVDEIDEPSKEDQPVEYSLYESGAISEPEIEDQITHMEAPIEDQLERQSQDLPQDLDANAVPDVQETQEFAESPSAEYSPEEPDPVNEKTESPVDLAPFEQELETPIESSSDSDNQDGIEIPGLLDDIDVNDENFDQDILEVFIEEALELTEELDEAVDAWESDWEDAQSVEAIKRALHTFKGGARLSGLNNLGELTHEYESFLITTPMRDVNEDFFNRIHEYQDKVSAGARAVKTFIDSGAQVAKGTPAERGDIELLPETPDGVQVPPEFEDVAPQETQHDETILEHQQELEPETQDSHVVDESNIENINPETEVIEEESLSSPEDHTIVVESAAEPVDAEQQSDSSSEDSNVVPFSPKIKTAPVPAPSSAASKEFKMPNVSAGQAAAKKAGPQEVVRVGAELLEELVNLAGETSISRSRLEQYIFDFTHSLDEMDSTLSRLQEQLRRLDIETEAQVLFRQEQMAQHEEFDPLEMDRYSALQQLTRSLSESSSDLVDLKEDLSDKLRDTETLLVQQQRINTNLQEGLMRSRMVPFSRLVPRLRRIVRQVSGELNKNVSFELDNVEGELDRSVLERMVPPFEHMLRNAVDHGIELPEERVQAGKSETGRIVLTLGREGGDVIIHLADDGRGVDLERVKQKAIERGLMTEDAELSDHDIMQFILHAGFSTAENVTQISGRGVGMDVVHSEIKQLGGSMSINSKWGHGTEFVIRLPFTVSVNRALMVQIGQDNYAVPLSSIEGIVRVSPFELEHYYDNPDARFEYANENYHVRYLGALLDIKSRPKLDGHVLPLPVLLVRSAEHTMALHVDSLMGSREIVVKSLGQQFAAVTGLSGATVMGDGAVVVILDPHALVRQEIAKTSLPKPEQEIEKPEEAVIESTTKTVMVVDDSVTVRKVTSRFLEREGFDVMTAKDGVDALRVLQEQLPDVMLLDIEMPRMDGFEVAKNIRTTRRWQNLPIIMITSRTGDKHREHALSLGVNKYLGKPYQEDTLLSSINELIEEAKSAR